MENNIILMFINNKKTKITGLDLAGQHDLASIELQNLYIEVSLHYKQELKQDLLWLDFQTKFNKIKEAVYQKIIPFVSEYTINGKIHIIYKNKEYLFNLISVDVLLESINIKQDNPYFILFKSFLQVPHNFDIVQLSQLK